MLGLLAKMALQAGLVVEGLGTERVQQAAPATPPTHLPVKGIMEGLERRQRRPIRQAAAGVPLLWGVRATQASRAVGEMEQHLQFQVLPSHTREAAGEAQLLQDLRQEPGEPEGEVTLERLAPGLECQEL
jgi:hypothetical protein